MKKFFCYLLLVTCTLLLAGCSDEAPVEVKTEKISAADNLTLTHDGKISFSSEVMVYSNVSGTVVEKFFKDGDDVMAGQTIFKIGSQEAENELREKKAKLAESMAKLPRELAAKNPVDKLQADIAELQMEIDLLEEEASAGMISAPIAGQIGIDNARLGAEVKANETVLAKIGSINPAVVRFEVSAEEKNFLQAGTPKVTLKFPDGTTYHRAGTLKFIDDKTAEVTFDNTEEILLLNNDAVIELGDVKIANALLVPESAIQQRDGENFVFVDENKTAVLKKVSLGGKFGNKFVVNDGLKTGDSVVVEALTNLREGTPLKSN